MIHSASKYLGGHSDINGGAICGSREWINKLTRWEINLLGTILAPFPAWLLVRGLRTLEVRLKRHEESANRIALWMESMPGVERVHHVGLESFPQRDLYQKQMRGTGGLFSFEPKHQCDEEVRAFAAKLQYFRQAVSWGGFESLIIPIKTKPLGYSEDTWVVRLFIGLEDAGELMEDLEQAMHESGLSS